MNKVEVTSPKNYTGPYTVKINGQEIKWISDIDLNGLMQHDLLVSEFHIKTEK